MKQKYTITLLDLPVSVVSDEDEETVNALAKELNEKIAHNYLMYSQWYKEE